MNKPLGLLNVFEYIVSDADISSGDWKVLNGLGVHGLEASEILLDFEFLLERNLALKLVLQITLGLECSLLLSKHLNLGLGGSLLLACLVPFLHDLIVLLDHLVIVVRTALALGFGLEELLVRLSLFVKLFNLLLQRAYQWLQDHELREDPLVVALEVLIALELVLGQS
jgi:hypothetical protein